MIETVVNVGAVWVLQALLKSFPGRFRCVLGRHIFDSLGFVKDTSFTLDSEMLTKLSEPAKDRAVSREWTKSDLIKGLFETKYFKGIFLS